MTQFTEQTWDSVLSSLAEVLGPDVAGQYQDKQVPKLIASIPYLAGSEDPDRFAVSNLLTYYGAAKARGAFSHRPEDDADLMRRLATFHVGRAADPNTVEYGLKMLALVMLNDHEQDKEEDAASGKYNPVAAGVWGGEERQKILDYINSHPDMKRKFDEAIKSDLEPLGFWGS